MLKLNILLVVGVIAKQVYGDAPEAIVGGNVALPGQFKHQISLQVSKFHICGGSLISENYVVTAAHCVEDPGDHRYMTVVTGAISSRGMDGERHKIKCIRMHPGYTGKKEDGWKDDIAVLTLETPAKENNLQGPIPLASRDYADGNYRGLISGWGKTNVKSSSSPVLNWIEVNVLTRARCLSEHNNPNKAHTNQKHICTLEEFGKGACQGDSGGPLTVNGELCGVVSWVIPCAFGASDVFTNVFYYLDFIKECQEMC
ncbi:chymotrypsin-1-like [Odontomachus brunneus]|uniref:chymotrypsin-1-like n=1 Tax=Odontomachus brunneus TaxID=486640 RepID=UPI0013F28DDB|nr:chymotrypsin-1-like [Odontomachus brunneus]